MLAQGRAFAGEAGEDEAFPLVQVQRDHPVLDLVEALGVFHVRAAVQPAVVQVAPGVVGAGDAAADVSRPLQQDGTAVAAVVRKAAQLPITAADQHDGAAGAVEGAVIAGVRQAFGAGQEEPLLQEHPFAFRLEDRGVGVEPGGHRPGAIQGLGGGAQLGGVKAHRVLPASRSAQSAAALADWQDRAHFGPCIRGEGGLKSDQAIRAGRGMRSWPKA